MLIKYFADNNIEKKDYRKESLGEKVVCFQKPVEVAKFKCFK